MIKLIPDFISKLFTKRDSERFSDKEVIALNKKRNKWEPGDVIAVSDREMEYLKGEREIMSRYRSKYPKPEQHQPKRGRPRKSK